MFTLFLLVVGSFSTHIFYPIFITYFYGNILAVITAVISSGIISGVIVKMINKAIIKSKINSEECRHEAICYNLEEKQIEYDKVNEMSLNLSESIEIVDEDYIKKVQQTKKELTILHDFLTNYQDFYKWQSTNRLYDKLDNGYYDKESIKYIEKVMAREKSKNYRSLH